MKKRNSWAGVEALIYDSGFHVVLDNDMFFVYPNPPPEYDWTEATDEDSAAYDEWQASGITMDYSPEELLVFMIELMGGSYSRV